MKEFVEKLIEKIKVTSLEIIVTGTKDKPYFEIKYKVVGKEDYNIGYSSYDLNNVLNWKEECFEIVNQLAEEYKQCTLCYLQSPCEYQNVNILLEHYDSEVSDCYLSSDGNCSFINNKGKCECLEAQILECLKELEQYRAIGTFEEFKALKEDSRFLKFLYDFILPNEMERYLSMYKSSDIKTTGE